MSAFLDDYPRPPWKAVTPCPGECCWRLFPADAEVPPPGDGWGALINMPEMGEGEAKFIVRCVNAHDTLVTALQLVARTKSSEDRPQVQAAIDAARSALALLEAL